MKTALGILLSLGLAFTMMAQPAAPSPAGDFADRQDQWMPASRSAHETVWQSVVLQTNALGRVVVRTNSYTELATGLNYYDEATQAWQPSREEWQVYPDGIVAQAGRHKVILAHNLNRAGAVDVLTPDGVRLVSSPVGLGFYDPVDGKQVLLAEVRDCEAQRGAAANEIVFRDCFEGIRGSIRYLYTRAGFHQHVVIEERLALPAGFSDKSRLELYTEFAADTPAPRLETRVLWGEPDPGLRALMVEPDFTDAEIAFGAEMAMRAGKAFSLGTESEETPERSVRVGKQFVEIEGMPVLIEAVEFRQIEPLLAGLAAVETAKTDRLAINTTRRINGPKEQARLSQERFGTERTGDEIQLASQPLSQPAVVIDYELLGSATSFTFKGDTTYFVTNAVYLDGTTTIEGGAVIKSAVTQGAGIVLGDWDGAVVCKTGPYRPAVFTSKHDNTVGQIISGSSGNPARGDFATALAVQFEWANVGLHGLRIAYATTGLQLDGYGGAACDYRLTDIQILRCDTGIAFGGNLYLGNALIYEFESEAIHALGSDSQIVAEHITAYNPSADGVLFAGETGSNFDFYLRNSLLCGLSAIGASVNFISTPQSVPPSTFQAVGAGACYLANNSTNRNAGTTNINADLLAALKAKTTYPPVLLSNVTLTASTNLVPQVARDTDTPDLGFHYDPLDFAVSNVVVTNATLVLSNGVALGGFAGTGGSAILIKNHGRLISDGSPLNPNVIVRYNSSQEQANFNWGGSGKGHLIGTAVTTSSGEIDLRFTLLAAQGSLLSAGRLPEVTFRNCQFYGGHIAVSGDCGDFENPDVCTWSITNCLFERITFAESLDATAAVFRNNLLVGGLVGLDLFCWSSANFRDNFFDRTILWDTGGVDRDYNGYINGFGWQSWDWAPTTNDVIVTNMVYEAGPLGDYYLPTSSPLLNAGSVTNAALAGLYHYTTTTNQVKETNSIVDIGFHYVAVDTTGNPVSSYWTTIPDYLADPDGSGDLSAWLLQHFGQLGVDPDDDPDGDWITNVQEYQAGSNPRDVMVVAWGNNSFGQCEVPDHSRHASLLGGGLFHTVMLQSNGVVIAWGDNEYDQTNVPAALTNAVAIAAGAYHSLALRADGSAVIWGDWWTESGFSPANFPSAWTNLVAVAAGADHDLALRSDGTIATWSYYYSTPYTEVPAGLPPATAIAAGWDHSVALLNNGTVVAWGLNYSGFGWNLTNVPAGLSNVVAIAAGGWHTLALRSDGTVVAWGAGNGTNLSGNFLNSEQGQSIVPAGLSNVVAIAATGHRSLALRADGTTVGWGELGPATPPPGVSNLTAVAAGLRHTAAIRDGRQLPIILQHPSDQAAPAGGSVTFTAKGLGLAGVKYQWQFDGVNIVGATNATLSLNNVQASHEGSYQVVISTGAGSFTSAEAAFTLITPPGLLEQTEPERQWAGPAGVTLAVVVSGQFLNYQWKLNGTNIPYATASAYVAPFFSTSEERQYSVAITNAAGVTNSRTWEVKALPPGGIAAWGRNDDNQLDWPVTATNVIAVAAGGSHSLAAREDGSVLAWGLNDAGQTNAPTLTNAISVAAGHKHSLALRDNGTVVAWGRNVEGQTTVPDGLTNVIAIGACGNQSIALRKNGTVTNWGNTNGPIPGNLTNAIAIAAGTNFSLALRSNATLAAWGNNSHGQTNVPASATNVVAIAAGDLHALALKENGTVVAWGLNTLGQCDVPFGLSNVMAIAAGRAHSAALKNDGTVVAWGANNETQADVGGGLNGIKLLAAGGDHTLVSAFSPLVQYQVDVSKDLLLIYNSSSTNSSNVWHYYMQHRPMVSGANVLPVNCHAGEQISTNEFVTELQTPWLNWLNANPTKHPTYIILFPYVPQLLTNGVVGEEYRSSVSVLLHKRTPGIKPFVTCISMTNAESCFAYINKLAAFGTNGQLIISANTSSYANTNFCFDGALEGGDGTDFHERRARDGVLAYGASAAAVIFAAESDPRISTATNVGGYLSEGNHGWQRQNWAINGSVIFGGDSGWYIMATDESLNGRWYDQFQNGFNTWFAANALGGTNYSNTPVGAVCHVEEPGSLGNDAYLYYGLWQAGKSFAICAWVSWKSGANTRVQAVGDPFVRR